MSHTPGWVTHLEMQQENCDLRNQLTALRAALAALEAEMRAAHYLHGAHWADRLARILKEHAP